MSSFISRNLTEIEAAQEWHTISKHTGGGGGGAGSKV